MLNKDNSTPKTPSGPLCLVPHLLVLALIALVLSGAGPAHAPVTLRADADAGNAVDFVLFAALAAGTHCSLWSTAAVQQVAHTTLAHPAVDAARPDRRIARSQPRAPSAERRSSMAAQRARAADYLVRRTASAVGLVDRSRSGNGTKGVRAAGQAWVATANREVSDPLALHIVETRNMGE